MKLSGSISDFLIPLIPLGFFGVSCQRIKEPSPRVIQLSSHVAMPVNWKEANAQAHNLAGVAYQAENWWKLFQNDDLNQLIDQALENEPNVRLACARVEEFHAMTSVARTRIFPRIDFAPSVKKEKISETDTPLGISPRFIRDESFTRYQLPFHVSYSVDLFGKFKPKARALENQKAAACADLEAAALLISGEVARAYFLYQSLQEEVSTLQKSLNEWDSAIDLHKTIFESGQTTEQEVALARLEAAQVEAELIKAQGDLRKACHAMARLTGLAPAMFETPRTQRIPPPPAIPPGIPSDLLCRRPDIRAARSQMTAGFNEVEAERLSVLPTLDLTTAGGFASADLLNLIQTNSLAWSVGASLVKTIYDAGENKYQQKVKYAQYKQLAANYDKVLLDALKEVEDALSELETLRKSLASNNKAKDAAQDLVEIAQTQYNKGLSNYLSVIAAERALLMIERKENQINAALNNGTIQLIVALGGGC